MFDKKIDNTSNSYGDDAIVTLSPREHIRLRPGMYIGKLGDGSQADDGIYVLIKEVVDNSVDEFIMGAGKQIDVTVEDDIVTVRDYGRGIPLKSLAAAVSEMNTGGKYGGSAFKKTVGLNGVGVKAVNMLSSEFTARSVRASPSRTERAVNSLESMLTALTPTPFRPTVFLKAVPPYLPPVFISLTAAASDLSGMPRP